MQPVRIDQAVFTSASNTRGEGYRIVAASAGITPDERRAIQTCAPSHGGLSSDEPDSVSVGFLPLPSGRLCVMHSINAGMEQTGRGGRRVYTHLLVFDDGDFAAFAYNPFHVLRLADQVGALTPNPKATGTLEPLDLTPEPDACAATKVAAGIENVDPARMRDCVERLLAGRKLVLSAPNNACELAEALWLGLPAPQRASISFATGLKFSLSRGLTLNFIDPDNAPNPRFLRGPGIERIDLAEPVAKPAPDDRTWGAMVELLWKYHALDDLITISSSRQLASAADTLDRTIDLTLDAHAVLRADLQTVITLCTKHAGTAPYSQIEGEVLEWFWIRVGKRLVEIWPTPQDDAARTDWHVLSELPHRNPLVPGLIADSLKTLLNRLAEHDAFDAVASALVLAQEPRNPWDDVLKQCEPNLLKRLVVWATKPDPDADIAHRISRCLKLAEEWQSARGASAHAVSAVTTLRSRLNLSDVQA
jgi:hypothetical protein